MSQLVKYHRKRHFQQTPEPKGKVKKEAGNQLIFTVQKHDASRLHYDFRLECNGVLKSWAIPKGPSLNPEDKRLAIMVEDHPYDYHDFEGIIPEGNYGAGTVMLWDEGTYSAAKNPPTKKENEKIILEGIEKGHLDFILNGTKLKGAFVLVRIHGSEDNQWLFFKKKDEYVEKKSVLKQDLSVQTGRSMDEIAGKSAAIHESELDDYIKDTPKIKMPEKIKPMLGVLAAKPFNKKGWLFEIKWDGYRALAFIKKNKIQLYSRNYKSYNTIYSPIVDDLEEIDADVILDGEIAALDKNGKPQFQLLQNYQRTREGNLFYYVFDIIYLNGHDLTGLPLIKRKEILKLVLPSNENSRIRYSDHIKENGIPFFQEAEKNNLEGIMGKDGQSSYSMTRSKSWLKIKTHLSQEVVIGGYTQPKGARSKMGALLVGVYEKGKKNGKLTYVGHVGGGFTERLLNDVFDRLETLVTKECPFKIPPKPNTSPTWVKPELVCEVSFTEWTADGNLRHPIFKGLRFDKEPNTVVREVPEA